MDFAALEVQIFVSLALVLGAVFIALLTDFLKGNNEALRERNIELVVRQEERERQSARSAQPAQRPAEQPAALPEAEPELPPLAAAASASASEAFEVETSEMPTMVEAPSEKWATSGELAAVDAIAARIRESIEAQPDEPAEAETATEAEEEILAQEAEIAEPQPAAEAVAEAESEAEVEPPAAEPEFELEAAAEPESEPAETVKTSAGAPAAEPVAEEASAGSDEAEEKEDLSEKDLRDAANLPRFTVHAKVTPIDIVAAERSVASEAMELAQELERVADFASSETPEEDEAGNEETALVEQSAAEEAYSEEPAAEEALAENPEIEEAPATEPAAGETEETAPQGVTISRNLFTPEESASEEYVAEIGEDAVAEEAEVPAVAGESEEPGAIEEPAVAEEPEAPAAAASVETEPEEIAEPEYSTMVIPEPPATAQEETLPSLKVPTGYQDYSLLTEALESPDLFRGTVVAIAVSQSGPVSAEQSLESIGEFIESLLTPADFACRTSEDEFLVILPEELGSQAQRRLQYLSQRLWDYQIRSVGGRAIMFSWGAAEIQGEPLNEAVEAAKDRMLQTKRTRERATSEIHHYRLRAAND